MQIRTLLLLCQTGFIIAAILFTVASFREREPRAPWMGFLGALIFLILGIMLFKFDDTAWLSFIPGVFVCFLLFFLLPGSPDAKSIHGSMGYIAGEIKKNDERDIVFARNRSLPPGSDVYRRYYSDHPEKEERDAKRRARGGPVGTVGAIDREYRPNTAMINANFMMPDILGPFAEPGVTSAEPVSQLDAHRATDMVKGFARHLGSDLVGICKVNPQFMYSHRGEIFQNNWEDWGKKISDPLPYAVVIATEMEYKNVCTAPHTPTLLESAHNYAKGAFITTILANWLSGMGYRAAAHHSRHYDMPLVPLAIDAGLGELGRFGYLIARKFGPRVRLFAVTTDFPLHPDQPIDLGVNEFCKRCKKCADSCPSRSIPHGDKVVFMGIEKWKLKEESCFDYWGKVGTDCSVCMAVCPYSRPNHSIHRLVRWILTYSATARFMFPYLDNLIYGKKWRSRKPAAWIDPDA
ncbi:MAG: reductive dehalogenase [Desulfobacterales bacterium]|nr:reductive dehalogenase [Desulfobacterales bacterium]